MNIIISWLAKMHDMKEGRANLEGPNYNLHKLFYNVSGHSKHILLYSNVEDTVFVKEFAESVKNDFRDHIIEFVHLKIEDVIDVREIQQKVIPFILKYKAENIELFISPGTPAMQVAWYLIHLSGVANTTLYQARPAKYTKSGITEFFEVTIDKSDLPLNINQKQILSEKPAEEKYPIHYKSIADVFKKAKMIAETDNVTTLIRGESGTGKDYLAEYIHNNSRRAEKPFLRINCSSFRDELLESRLFGHMKGSFTGAMNDTNGLFETANGGTIFLDEIGDISPYMQQSLLRVLQEKEILPIGATESKIIDVRIISATNKNLEEMCKEGDFRWDLYYRLSVVELELPSLKVRGENEIRDLINYFLIEKAIAFNKPKLEISKEALIILINYPFPGNIRELENLIEGFYVFIKGTITEKDIPLKVKFPTLTGNSLLLKDMEQKHIEYVLQRTNNNLTQASKILGIALNTLKNKIKTN